ncbi:DUF397 domain-containing protein [Actinomadura sp. 7K507]|uniref:DUF397 domain-containing protein n=1 Tax=Actinomadura sp. 7K507 TaxID=2530365 RepID=UPI001047B881|nr:DUF397 domain-containing protein [Actinomadura sp. 7K507]TDC97072.1 DUF397 domain-containing protein [Actinomadura sp. 7K507]
MEAMTPRLAWRKSTYSSSQGDHCIELAELGKAVGIRDSKDPDGPKLVVGRAAFRALVADLKR